MYIFCLLALLFCNPLFSAAGSYAEEHITVSKALVRDMVKSAAECRHSLPVALLTHFSTDYVHAALPENPENRKDTLRRLITNSAIDRHTIDCTSSAATDVMLDDLCCRSDFADWESIAPAALDCNPSLCRCAVEDIALTSRLHRFAQIALDCLCEKNVRYPERLKQCLLISPDLCALTDRSTNTTLFERCLSELFVRGTVSCGEFVALCAKPSDEVFEALFKELQQSHDFKCAVLKGILRHQLATQCVTDQPRAVRIYAIIAEMATRFKTWEQEIRGMRPLSEVFAKDDYMAPESFLDRVYGYLYSAAIQMPYRPRSEAFTFSELCSEMLRNAYLNNEISRQRRDSNSHVRDLLARLLMSMYYTRDFPIMPNEPLCPENPDDKRTLFYAALMGASDLPQYELVHHDFFEFCCDLPDAVFDDIVDKLSQSPEVKEWYANSVMKGCGRKFHYQFNSSVYAQNEKSHQRFKRLIEAVEGKEALEEHLRKAPLGPSQSNVHRRPFFTSY